MEKMINCTADVLAYAYLLDDTWKTVISKTAKVRIPEAAPELNDVKQFEQPDDIWAVMARDSIYINDKNPLIGSVLQDPKTALGHPCDVFLFDNADEETTKRITNQGIAAYSSIDSHPQNLSKHDKGAAIIEREPDRCESWEEFLKELKCNPPVPCNSLIIIDRYLFWDEAEAIYADALFNLEHMLNMMLPECLDCDFDLLLIFGEPDFGAGLLFLDIKGICAKLKRPYTINLELCAIKSSNPRLCSLFDDTHDRRFISNYYIGTVSRGFKVYSRKTKESTHNTQTMSYGCVFNQIESGKCPDLALHNAYCKTLYNFFRKQKDPYCYCINKEGNECAPNQLVNRLLY